MEQRQLWGDRDWTPPDGPVGGLDAEAVLEHAWQRMVEGVIDRHSPHHAPTLATVDADHRPCPRTVILRDADAPERTLLCHTRLDCAKVSHVRENPRVGWHSYDAAGKTQLIFQGTARVESAGPLVDARWAATGEGGRACYRRWPGAGTPIDGIADMTEVDHDGRSMFGVFVTRIDAIEWLWLHHAGHRRLAFAWRQAEWHATAIAP